MGSRDVSISGRIESGSSVWYSSHETYARLLSWNVIARMRSFMEVSWKSHGSLHSYGSPVIFSRESYSMEFGLSRELLGRATIFFWGNILQDVAIKKLSQFKIIATNEISLLTLSPLEKLSLLKSSQLTQYRYQIYVYIFMKSVVP